MQQPKALHLVRKPVGLKPSLGLASLSLGLEELLGMKVLRLEGLAGPTLETEGQTTQMKQHK